MNKRVQQTAQRVEHTTTLMDLGTEKLNEITSNGAGKRLKQKIKARKLVK